MTRSKLAYTPGTIGQIQGSAPPLFGQSFLGDTELALPWRQLPHDAYCPPMRHHIIAGVFRGDGTTAFKVGRRQLRVTSRPRTIIINPRCNDGWWECTGTPLVSNIYLGEERLQLCSDEMGNGTKPQLRLTLQLNDPKLFGILGLIAKESATTDLLSKLYMEHLVNAACMHLLRTHTVFPIAGTYYRGGLSSFQIRLVKEYMQAHLAEDIRLKDLADLVGRSQFHFCRAFRVATGSTPHQALVRLRVRSARKLLAQTKLSVTEVGMAVGYHTPSSFAHAFRVVLGETPSEFRRGL
jgi:AraC family transcriptional regulator